MLDNGVSTIAHVDLAGHPAFFSMSQGRGLQLQVALSNLAESPGRSTPVLRTRAYRRLSPGCTFCEIRVKSPSANDAAIVLHGVVYEVTSISISSPRARHTPGVSAACSMPSRVTFSPTEPGKIGCPSTCKRWIASCVKRQRAAFGPPWLRQSLWPSPSMPNAVTTATSMGSLGTPPREMLRE